MIYKMKSKLRPWSWWWWVFDDDESDADGDNGDDGADDADVHDHQACRMSLTFIPCCVNSEHAPPTPERPQRRYALVWDTPKTPQDMTKTPR